MVDDELLGYACEQFLGKSVTEIKSVILQTLEGHLRAILGEWLLLMLPKVCLPSKCSKTQLLLLNQETWQMSSMFFKNCQHQT